MTRSFIRRFARENRGLAALEFALIVPVMLFSLLGAVEITNGMLVNRKVTQTASTLADLVSQDIDITTAERNTIFAAAEGLLASVVTPNLRMRVTSIVADKDGKTSVDWSQSQIVEITGTTRTRRTNDAGFPPHAKGTKLTIPADIIAPGGSVILAEVEMQYDAMLGDLTKNLQSIFKIGTVDDGLTKGWTMQEYFYLKPRRTMKVTFTP